MNALNAILFATFGVAMEFLPKVFPSWFPHTSADSTSARALWLNVMGFVQLGLGLGYIFRAYLVPLGYRIFWPATETGAMALPNPRAAAR
jgi:hypothetical protein